MRDLTTTELSRLQASYEDWMFDECEFVVKVSQGTDDMNMPIPDWITTETAVPCGYDPTATSEILGETQKEVIDGAIRLSIDYADSLSSVDRIRLTKRHGVALDTPKLFALIGHEERGPAGIVWPVRLVTDGSV